MKTKKNKSNIHKDISKVKTKKFRVKLVLKDVIPRLKGERVTDVVRQSECNSFFFKEKEPMILLTTHY